MDKEREEISIEDLVEKERGNLGTTALTKVTLETFVAWKRKKMQQRAEAEKKEKVKKTKGKKTKGKKQCCGFLTFWCGSGSADSCLSLMDPYSDPDPAIFVIDLQDSNKKPNFFEKVFRK